MTVVMASGLHLTCINATDHGGFRRDRHRRHLLIAVFALSITANRARGHLLYRQRSCDLWGGATSVIVNGSTARSGSGLTRDDNETPRNRRPAEQDYNPGPKVGLPWLERETRLELATPTLARSGLLTPTMHACRR